MEGCLEVLAPLFDSRDPMLASSVDVEGGGIISDLFVFNYVVCVGVGGLALSVFYNSSFSSCFLNFKSLI